MLSTGGTLALGGSTLCVPHACASEGSGLAAAASSGMKCALLGLAKSPSKKGAGEWPRSEREEDQPAGARSPSRCLPNMLRKVRLVPTLRATAGPAEEGVLTSSCSPPPPDFNLELARSREAAWGRPLSVEAREGMLRNLSHALVSHQRTGWGERGVLNPPPPKNLFLAWRGKDALGRIGNIQPGKSLLCPREGRFSVGLLGASRGRLKGPERRKSLRAARLPSSLERCPHTQRISSVRAQGGGAFLGRCGR